MLRPYQKMTICVISDHYTILIKTSTITSVAHPPGLTDTFKSATPNNGFSQYCAISIRHSIDTFFT